MRKKGEIFTTRATNVARACVLKLLQGLYHDYVDAHMRSSFSAHAHAITIKERTSKVYFPIFSVIYSYEAHPHILSNPLLDTF